MKITFIGHGNVGAPLADHLQRLGHQVTLATSDAGSESVKKALVRNPKLKVEAPREAVGAAEVVFLATPFQANEEVLKGVAGELITQLGWEPVDAGGLEQALHLEHMTLLWVRMVRMGGASAHMVWAALRR